MAQRRPSDLTYLEVFSEAADDAGRTTLDQRWVITPHWWLQQAVHFRDAARREQGQRRSADRLQHQRPRGGQAAA
jgi:hypothetical protein